MKDSWLSLERHIFRRIAITASEAPDLKEVNTLSLALNVAHHKGNTSLVKIGLSIHILAEPQKNPAYTGEIEVEGIFRVGEGSPAKIVITNGASILYGAAREMLINVTSRGPWPAVSLGVFSFVEMADDLISQSAEQPALGPVSQPEVAAL